MEISRFFTSLPEEEQPSWVDNKRVLRVDFLEAIRHSPAADFRDLELGEALALLARRELVAYGTGGGWELNDEEIRIALSALRAVVQRVGIKTFSLPFRDFSSFQAYWNANGCRNSYDARRRLIALHFDPLEQALEALADKEALAVLPTSVSGNEKIGWEAVDRQVRALRQHLLSASTPEDFRTIGYDAVHLFEALGQHVYDPEVHRRPNEAIFAKGETKNRIERFIEDSYQGPENAELRKLVRSAIEYAQKIKHGSSSSRREAVIIGSSVILLTEILHQLSLPE
jgi:hypothetical protein